MCGICGIYNTNGRPPDELLLRRMNSVLFHRGPDGEGFYLDPHIGLAHRRLSIIDLEAGKQPMGNEDGLIQVVFNGEIYNFLELRKLLEAKGHVFRTRSDTESIVHGYEEWGEGVVEKLRGMFAIAIWDGRNRKLVLARDRIGKKPLYYYLDSGRLLFASELKSLLKDKSVPRDIDLQALDAYLSFGYVPSPHTIFKKIRKLPPAHIAVLSSAGFSLRPYWHLDMESTGDCNNEETVIEELRQRFDEAVRIRLISDVPLGAFLSGGVDSSAVVATMAVLDDHPVKTASIGFSDERFDELVYARAIARQYGTDHTEFVVEPDALAVLDNIVWHFDEPFADASAIPTYYVSQMARKKVTVALSGDGGDESLAGYIERYYLNCTEDRIRKKIPSLVRRSLLGPVARVYPKADFLPRPLRLKNFLTNLSLSFEQAYYRDMSFYFTPEMKKRLYKPWLAAAVEEFDAFEFLGKHFRANNNSDVTSRVQYVDIKTYLPEDILVKVDRMSMAHSLEIRSPLLDHTLLEFLGRLPSSVKLRGRTSKYIFKRAMEDRLPHDILYRKKQGFSIPLASWLRGSLQKPARESLFPANGIVNDYFETKYLDRLWKQHQAKVRDVAYPLWGLIMLQRWWEIYARQK